MKIYVWNGLSKVDYYSKKEDIIEPVKEALSTT